MTVSYHTAGRSEEHTSELQSHSGISYAVFCLKKKSVGCAKNQGLDSFLSNRLGLPVSVADPFRWLYYSPNFFDPDYLHDIFFFNDTTTTEIYTPLYTLSLHDALPISEVAVEDVAAGHAQLAHAARPGRSEEHTSELQSHSGISYAVFCLKKKKIS